MRDANGRSMGDRAALRSSGTARYLVLKPGDTVTATVRYPKSGACKAGTSRRISSVCSPNVGAWRRKPVGVFE